MRSYGSAEGRILALDEDVTLTVPARVGVGADRVDVG